MKELAIKLETLNSNRESLVLIMAAFFAAIIAASLFISANFGYFLFICLAMGMISAPLLGRYWCNWMCPRGSFLEYFLTRFSLRKTFPPLFKRGYFLAFVVVVFMFMMGLNFFNLYQAHPAVSALGITLTRLLVVSTIVAMVLGIAYEPRAWCVFCPGATFAKLAAAFKSKKPHLVNDAASCTSCQVCAGNCPFHIDASQSGVISDPDCLKCFACVEKCPSKALRFSDQA
ncbi:MAG: 4Fe-4S binding protein [Geobacteraceae bacterium]|nr:4Fe-4S binding protein [Geobacteraceae bacterium]